MRALQVLGRGFYCLALGRPFQQGGLGRAPAPSLCGGGFLPVSCSMGVLRLSLLRARETGKNHPKLPEQNQHLAILSPWPPQC